MTDSTINKPDSLNNKLKICRICGTESENGRKLFNCQSEIQKIAVQICSFISIKLQNVQIYPNWICPGCHLQFEATDDFFELIKNGQNKICEAYGYPTKPARKPKRRRRTHAFTVYDNQLDGPPSDNPKSPVLPGKRISKKPDRFKDTMQGNELEDLYTKIGLTKRKTKQSETEAIAHIEDQDGVTLGEMISTTDHLQRNKTRYQCDICAEIFVKELALYSHLANHTNILYQCTECQAVFQAKAIFNEHVRQTKHIGLGIIETPPEIQNENLQQGEQPKTETEIKKLRKFVCICCSKSFDTNLAMQRHQKTHYQVRPFQCEICLARFKRKSVLQIHKSTHRNEHPFKCHKCTRRFTLNTTLQNHLKWVHDGIKPYICKICAKAFGQKSNLKEHKRIHTGDRPFVCLKCGYAFKTSSQCRLHQKTHVIQVNNTIEKEKENIQKTIACQVCGKLFAQKSAMKKHLRIHTGEKPYCCHLCPRKFSDPSNFSKHKISHLQEKKQKKKSKRVTLLKSKLTKASSSSDSALNINLDPDPDGLMPVTASESFNILENIVLPSVDNSLIGIMNGDDDDNVNQWHSDLMVTDIPNDESSIVQQQKQQEMLLNQLVCISYQDPMNPVSSKTTYYLVNQGV